MELMVNVDNYKKKAQTMLSGTIWDYLETGALDEFTLKRNEAAFQNILLRPRVLRNVSKLDLSTTILGERISMPICIAPTAAHQSLTEDGEKAAIRATYNHKTMMCLSSLSNFKLEEVAEAEPNALKWFQLYVFRDRANAVELIQRAEKAGYKAIVLTCCAPTHPIRERCIRSGITLPNTHPLRNLEDLATRLNTNPINLFKYDLLNTMSWEDIAFFKQHTKLPIVLKGIQDAEDAKIALKYGVDAIWVSNHGGRMLDGVDATINLLPEIVKAVNGKVEVYFDSGIRRGTDILKALALGARAVFIGRPILWGMTVSGEKGINDVLAILKKEFMNGMMFTGCRNISEITEDIVRTNIIRPKL